MRIASVEDDEDQAEMIRQILTGIGHVCEGFASGATFMAAARREPYDLVVLDWQLPDMSGLDLLRWVRNELGDLPPVLFVTNRTLEDDMVRAIEAGADDYMVKPVRAGEMGARIQAILRRALPDVTRSEDLIQIGSYSISTRSQTVRIHGDLVSISPREFDLVLFLFRNVGKTLNRETVEKAVWGRQIGRDSRTVDTHLSRLRVKLALRPENGVKLVSVYGKGFRLECVDSNESEVGVVE
ncbi:response regulator, OmpR-family [Pandoraea eparura]|uniref:Response regulator, OmpR-family n=1 Tax=Pandoraea eparura TaxID=2508291 RepID=A0A5E4WRB4_9BURK|nr:response regulator transcription factor [Pandoraea eparura]VVE25485.1 response regulator, OmpR-family [Pandoraea eparura]